MTFEERYGMKREELLREVRLRQRVREDERIALLTEQYRLTRQAGVQLPSAAERIPR